MNGIKGKGEKGLMGGKGMASFGKGFDGQSPADVHSNLFVGNLPEGATQSSVETAFSPFGQIQSCFVSSRDGRSYGFVKFESVESASRAIAAMNGVNGWVVKFANKDREIYSTGKGQGKGGGIAAVPSSSSSKPSHPNV